MGKVNLQLSDELEYSFRKAVADRLGMKKGHLSKALHEAIEMWIKS